MVVGVIFRSVPFWQSQSIAFWQKMATDEEARGRAAAADVMTHRGSGVGPRRGASKQAKASTNQLPAVAGRQSETRSCHSWEASPSTRSSERSAHVHFGTPGTDAHNKQAMPPSTHKSATHCRRIPRISVRTSTVEDYPYFLRSSAKHDGRGGRKMRLMRGVM